VDNAHGTRPFEVLWPKGAPNAKGTDAVDIPKITLYPAPAAKANGAAVIVVPGGAYAVLASDHEGKMVAEWLNGIGVSAYVLQYRVGPRYHHPAPIRDMQRAMRLVRSHATEWHLDLNRIGVLGFSAGGHLAATVATHYDDGVPDAKEVVERFSSRPDFAILAYPVISMMDPFTNKASRDNLLGEHPDPLFVSQLSNEKHVTKSTPPVFLFHTADDGAVPVENSIVFYNALRREKVAVEMHIFAHGPHGVGLAPRDPALSQWPKLAEQWMRALGVFGGR
jgi:acetyl esterase/lipase